MNPRIHHYQIQDEKGLVYRGNLQMVLTLDILERMSMLWSLSMQD